MKFSFMISLPIRIDIYLSQETGVTRSKIKTLITDGKVMIYQNNQEKIITKPNYLLDGSGYLQISKFEDKNIKLQPWHNSGLLKILYQNDDYLIINKPSNLIVHPGAGNNHKTLLNILLAETPELAQKDTLRPGIVHRLDRQTSGLMVIAKNDKFYYYITEQFAKRLVNKRYLALVVGNFEHKEGQIKYPIGRDKINRLKMIVSDNINNSKEAITRFKVVESFNGFDLVEFKILTGRTHQIRVHSSYIGHPIFGDGLYYKNLATIDKINGQYLHAFELEFVDLNGELQTYNSPLPSYFEKKLEQLRAEKELTNKDE